MSPDGIGRIPVRVLTVDLEEWFHLLEHPDTADESSWGTFESRLEGNTERLLALFAQHRVKATFFTLGWVARRHPRILAQVIAAGHEIGSHSDVHALVHRQTPAEFRSETERSLRAIEKVTGAKVRYYRAPGFSITAPSAWAFEILDELGIEADLSLFPGSHAHGGFGEARLDGPTILVRGGARLRELPMTVAALSYRGVGTSMAYAGGGYFRLLPYPVIRELCRQNEYVMTYFHPRDFDPGQPVLPRLSLARRFKSYVGLGRAMGKLDRLLRDYHFVDVAGAVAAIDWSRVPELRV